MKKGRRKDKFFQLRENRRIKKAGLEPASVISKYGLMA
jgi:hypothetical protein